MKPSPSDPSSTPRGTTQSVLASDDPIHLEAPGGSRLDVWLASALPDVSRSEVQRWIEAGMVTLEGKPARARDQPAAGTRVEIRRPPRLPSRLSLEPAAINVVYEDSDLLVVDKAAGMVVHPGAGVRRGTLANALLAHAPSLSEAGGADRPGIVHRLDRDTSGLLVAAKNDRAHRSLAAQIAAKSAGREYRVICWGTPTWEDAVVRAAIGRDPYHRTRMSALPEGEGRAAETHLGVVERLPLGVVLRATLRTGRTHQIRVHCAWSGVPVVGDPVYGNSRPWLSRIADRSAREALTGLRRQALHACKLSFRHPSTGEQLEFHSDPPEDWQAILSLMRVAQPAEGPGRRRGS